MAAGTPEAGTGTTTSARRRRLTGELGADALPRLVDADSFGDAVGPRKVDVLEDAEALRGGAERLDALHSCFRDDDQLARLDVAHEFGADDVEGYRLGRQDHGAVEPAQHQRTHAEWGSRTPIIASLVSATSE